MATGSFLPVSLRGSFSALSFPSLGQPFTLKGALVYIGGAAALAAIVGETSWLLLRARLALPGPFFRPFGGVACLLSMVLDPVGFWNSKAQLAATRGMSLDVLFGTPVVFVTNNALSKTVA